MIEIAGIVNIVITLVIGALSFFIKKWMDEVAAKIDKFQGKLDSILVKMGDVNTEKELIKQRLNTLELKVSEIEKDLEHVVRTQLQCKTCTDNNKNK